MSCGFTSAIRVGHQTKHRWTCIVTRPILLVLQLMPTSWVTSRAIERTMPKAAYQNQSQSKGNMQRAQSQKSRTAHDEWLAPLLNKESLREYNGITIADGLGSVDSFVGIQTWFAGTCHGHI